MGQGKWTREEIVEPRVNGKSCGVAITEGCVRVRGGERGRKGWTEIPRMGRTGRHLGGNFARNGTGRNGEGRRSVKGRHLLMMHRLRYPKMHLSAHLFICYFPFLFYFNFFFGPL